MTDTTFDQQASSKPARRCRTDADRLADMQAELASLHAVGEAKALAASAETAAPKPARARATRGHRPQKRAARPSGTDGHLDA
ncbi:MAG: hypothetical protein ABI054_09200 [Planctomycetota bacterium]